MSSLKTILTSALISGLLALVGSPAMAMSPDNHIRFFAQCAGRLSAQMEFQWMFDGIASERTKAERQSAIDILEAMTPPGRGREILHWRIEAKQAQAVLLSQGAFRSADRRARLAEAMANRLLNECRSALIS